jgi:putative membrane protein
MGPEAMARLLIRWAILTAAIILTSVVASWLPFFEFTARFGTLQEAGTLFLGAAALALLNGTIGAVLKLLTLPLNCLTLGLMSLIINGLILLAAAGLGLGFEVGGFWSAVAGAALISLFNGLLGGLAPDGRDSEED